MPLKNHLRYMSPHCLDKRDVEECTRRSPRSGLVRTTTRDSRGSRVAVSSSALELQVPIVTRPKFVVLDEPTSSLDFLHSWPNLEAFATVTA